MREKRKSILNIIYLDHILKTHFQFLQMCQFSFQ